MNSDTVLEISPNGQIGIKNSGDRSDNAASGVSSPSPKRKYTTMVLSLNPENPVAAVKNVKSAVTEIKRRLKNGPIKDDGQGFIYMYRDVKDWDPKYRKIGKTSKLPNRRVDEWEKKRKELLLNSKKAAELNLSPRANTTAVDKNLVIVGSWKVKRRGFAEKLIHWLLDMVRVYRYPLTLTVEGKLATISRYKQSKKFVEDPAYKQFFNSGMKFDKMSKHIEWFLADEDSLIKVIKSVVLDVNTHWADEPWRDDLKDIMN